MEKKRKGYLKTIGLSLLIVLLVSVLALGGYGYYKVLNTDLVYDGIYIDEFNISLMTKEEALELLKDNKEAGIDEKSMKLFYGDREYNVVLRDLGFYFDYNKAIDQAYLIGREGNAFNRIKSIYETRQEGRKIELESGYETESVAGIVEPIVEEINLEMLEAEFDFNNGNPIVSQEVIGKEVDVKGLTKNIKDNVYKLNSIEIPVEDILPSKTKDALSRVNGVIGEYSTAFKTSSEGRSENIRISSDAIKGSLIMPGEVFSFNVTTGPRAASRGYQGANEIVNGELTEGIGGGVCQTSTTLYNALLRSNLAITERSPHSIPIGYVEYGQDAAVAYDYMDLKFRNNFDFPVYLDAEVSNKEVHMYVYGDRNAKDYKVEIDSETVEVVEFESETIKDETLPPGSRKLVQGGRKGLKVDTYKSIIRDGKVVSRDRITKDYYRPRNSIYRVGP